MKNLSDSFINMPQKFLKSYHRLQFHFLLKWKTFQTKKNFETTTITNHSPRLVHFSTSPLFHRVASNLGNAFAQFFHPPPRLLLRAGSFCSLGVIFPCGRMRVVQLSFLFRFHWRAFLCIAVLLFVWCVVFFLAKFCHHHHHHQMELVRWLRLTVTISLCLECFRRSFLKNIAGKCYSKMF